MVATGSLAASDMKTFGMSRSAGGTSRGEEVSQMKFISLTVLSTRNEKALGNIFARQMILM